jgi:nicotinamidase-related amidase
MQVGHIETPLYRGSALLMRIQRLIFMAREARTPVIYLQHNDPRLFVPGSAAWQIHSALAPARGEIVIQKRSADGFYNTTLHGDLMARSINHLIVVGCRSEYGIDSTVRRALSLDYNITLISDGHTTADSDLMSASMIIAHHNLVLSRLNTEQHSVTLKECGMVTFQPGGAPATR